MTLSERIEGLSKLGDWLQNAILTQSLEEVFIQARLNNAWFVAANVQTSLQAIAQEFLDKQKLENWLTKYSLDGIASRKIGVVMAGNIPAVGFHDALCVLVSGHQLMAKVSADDRVLLLFLLEKLIEIEPRFKNQIQLAERLNAADAYIATGSDNTARYFEYYFAKKPHIIRRNRTSIGVLNGQETTEDFLALGHDVLQYFGLGCRNVSKIFVPQGYSFIAFYDAIEPLSDFYRHHHKFFNNYEYNKSIYLVNREPHFDNGFLITRASESLVSPISVLFFEEYESTEALTVRIASQQSKIQCVVSQNGWFDGSLSFGQAQQPSLSDYADGIDTMAFLAKLL
jgi:Acyl-CoA reductase (LuxC)